MRSNSGKDEGRNNMRDPTLRDAVQQKEKKGATTSSAKAPSDDREGRKD